MSETHGLPSGGKHFAGGMEPPAGVAADLARLDGFSESALSHFLDVVEVVLPEPASPGVDKVVETFSAEHGLAPNDVTRAAKAVRHVLRASAKLAVTAAQLDADLSTMVGPAAQGFFEGIFEAAMDAIRGELVARTITDHGKVLLGADWRVETIAMSNHGANLAAPLVVLTLRYEENGERKAVTLNALPSTLKKLQTILDAILA